MTTLTIDAQDPSSILRLGIAFCSAKALLSAVELGVFDALDEAGSLSAEGLCARTGLHPRTAERFLDLLVSLRLLRQDGGRFANTPSVSEQLLHARPTPLLGQLERANHTHYPAWASLTESLRTGGVQRDADYSVMDGNPQRLRRFLDLMDELITPIGPSLAGAVDWSGMTHVVDVGGGRGHLLSFVLAANPHLRGTVIDLPHNAGLFGELAAAHGLSDRMTFQGADFFDGELPPTDAVIYGHILHGWSPARRARLVRRAHDAIRPGGRLVVYEAMLDETANADPVLDYESRVDEAFTTPEELVLRLDRMLSTEGGSEYTERECLRLLKEIGFEVEAVRPLPPRDTLVIARR